MALAAAAACALVLVLGLGPLTSDRTAGSGTTPQGDPERGASVFTTAGCSGCHTLAAAGAKGKVGPNLDTLQPTHEQVVAQVTNGGGVMPSFRSTLTAQQIQDVAAYTSQASRGWRPGQPPAVVPPPATPAPPAVPPARAQRLLVRQREWRLLLEAGELQEGSVQLTVRNRGRKSHQLVLLRTARAPADLRVIRGRAAEPGRILRVLVRAGREKRLRLDLEPGVYVLLCNRKGHFQRGVSARLRVSPAPAQTPPAPPPAEPPAPAEPPPAPPSDGKGLFRFYCGGCHTLADAGTIGPIGPNLDEEQPDVRKVTNQVEEGSEDGVMPSFVGTLSEEQIRLIAEYVASATGAAP